MYSLSRHTEEAAFEPGGVRVDEVDRGASVVGECIDANTCLPFRPTRRSSRPSQVSRYCMSLAPDFTAVRTMPPFIQYTNLLRYLLVATIEICSYLLRILVSSESWSLR
ncbi:hypothetical protein HYDPIDRAFT_119564, partial [Hydnomerulius pinastri MD-312]